MFQWIKALFLSSVRWFKIKTVWVKRRGSDTASFLRGSFLRPYRTNKAAMDSLPAVIDRPYKIKLCFGEDSHFPEKITKTFKKPSGKLTLEGNSFSRRERRALERHLKT